MPEGDTIFRAARTLHLALAGKQVTKFETVLPALSRIHDDAPLTGRTIERVESRGKNLLMVFSGDLILRTHMRMNGSWHIYRAGERWRKGRSHMRVVVGAGEFVAVAFNVPVAEFVSWRDLKRHADLAAIGPDFLEAEFDLEGAIARIRRRPHTSIAELLLNQRVVAGIGNVYKSEVLFLCGINPLAKSEQVSDEDLRRVLETARKVMSMNVRAGADPGIVTYTGFRRTTGRSDPSERLWVYRRGGKPCRKCGTPIQRRKTGTDARSTYWCPSCQR